jgi:hypothetical protein
MLHDYLHAWVNLHAWLTIYLLGLYGDVGLFLDGLVALFHGVKLVMLLLRDTLIHQCSICINIYNMKPAYSKAFV